jgi:hypothetical protein
MAKKRLTWCGVLNNNELDFKRHSEKMLENGMKTIDDFVRGQKLNKRRTKAGRYERRYGGLKEEILIFMEEVMNYQPLDVELQWHGISCLVLEQRLEFGKLGLGVE